MIDRLKALFARPTGGESPEARLRLASAALLVEAAAMDGNVSPEEEDTITALLAGRFGVSEAEARELLKEATEAAEKSVQLLGFTREIKDALNVDERVRMIEMLWEVAYADGVLHDYEASLVRRISGLLYVPDQEAGAARKRALARLGLGDGLA